MKSARGFLLLLLATLGTACGKPEDRPGGGDGAPASTAPENGNTWAARDSAKNATGVARWELSERDDGTIELHGRDQAKEVRVHGELAVRPERIVVAFDAPAAWRFEILPNKPPATTPMPKEVRVALAASVIDVPKKAASSGLTGQARPSTLHFLDLLQGNGATLLDPEGKIELLCSHGVWGRELLTERWRAFLTGVFQYMQSHPECIDTNAGGVWDPETNADEANGCMQALKNDGQCDHPEHLYNLLMQEVGENVQRTD